MTEVRTGGVELAPTPPPAAIELEKYLGDAWAPDGRLAIPDAVATDERDQLPWPALTALRTWGMPGHLVPVALGGRLHSAEELFGLLRMLARRDMRMAVAYGSTFLGALPVWLYGDAAQRSWTAERILAGDLGSFAISERDHGSDLAGNEFHAERHGDRFRLSGEKWPIGNATRGSFVTVLAGTGAGRFSLFLIDKAELDPVGWHNLPMAPTVGLRGHDLSGLVFADCPVPASALLGREGAGLGQTLRTLQVTRTLIAGLSLGSLDTGLRVALGHADRRRLYGAPIAELPVIADTLLRGYLDLLIGECLALPAVRAVSVAPDRMGLWSAVVKYLVPVLAEEALAALATVLSARHYLREGTAELAFQKLQRDHAIASVFDGTTHVNLSAVASQLPAALAARTATTGPDRAQTLRSLFSRAGSAPSWQPDGSALRLTTDGADDITAGWPEAVRQVRALADAGAVPVARDLVGVLADWDDIRADYQRELPAFTDGQRDRQVPVRAYTLARIHTLHHAAAACLHTWLVNRTEQDDWFASGEWLLLCLQRLLQRLDTRRELSERYRDTVNRQLRHQYDQGLLFSLTPIALDGR